MNLIHRLLALSVLLFAFTAVLLAQSMTDAQVTQYVKEAAGQGKGQTEIARELMRKGVTQEQLLKIKNTYEQTNARKVDGTEAEQLRTRVPINGEEGITPRPSGEEAYESFIPEVSMRGGKNIFGRELFTNKNLSFEPNVNLATPVNYRLGPGDEVIIDIWGVSEGVIRKRISPEGEIKVDNLGPLYLNGKTIDEAGEYVKRELSKIHAGILDGSSEVSLTLGQNRTIQVNIMGEVFVPGTYTLSSFASLFHALYSAGGISPIGSLRSIQVVRNGKKIADADVYDYLMKGSSGVDIRLMEGDIIIVPPYKSLVMVSGEVKRPVYYEMKEGETISNLLAFSGGFTGNAYKQNIRLIRLSDREKQIYNIDEMDYSVFRLTDGDSLYVGAVLDRYENMVEVTGAVYRPGMFQLNGAANTIKQLIKQAEGLRGDAFLDRAQLHREREDLTLELVPINLKGIMNGTVADLVLQRNDILYIPSIHDLIEEGLLTIHGLVARPGTYIYAEGITIEDLIIQAGGLLEAASTARIDVSRRIKDPKRTSETAVVGKTISLELKDGYIIGDMSAHYLQPFDEVYVRKSPAYFKQQNISVSGEVLYSGSYALSKKNERITDIVHKAGGITSDAYIKGAQLFRKMTDDEIRKKREALRIARSVSDSTSVQFMDFPTIYPVGIDLQTALAKPGSDFDLVLREGDVLIIPEYDNTVRINGAVMHPNTVLYRSGEGKKHYINQAGGYGDRAKKKKVYVVYMNGTVARLKGNASKLIEPGCEIIVPTKEAKQGMTTAQIIGMSTSVASFAAVVAALVNVIK